MPYTRTTQNAKRAVHRALRIAGWTLPLSVRKPDFTNVHDKSQITVWVHDWPAGAPLPMVHIPNVRVIFITQKG